MAFAANADEDEEVDEAYYDALHKDDYRIQGEMKDPVAFMSATDEDTMYYDQATRAPDRQHFVEAVVKEVNDHITSKHWILMEGEAASFFQIQHTVQPKTNGIPIGRK
jgi:adenylosuccinate synthase